MARCAGLVLAAGMFLQLSLPASAQGPVRSETLLAGAYRLRVDLYTDPPFTGRRYDFDVLVSADRASDARDVTVTATAIPDAGTNATDVAATVTPASSLRSGFQGYVTMGVRGGWKLHFVVNGPAGTNAVSLPLEVTAPPEIPSWVAWSVALSPLLFLLLFAWRQRSYLANLKREASPGMPSASVPAET